MTEQFTPHPVGVWIDDDEVRARPGAAHFHGRIVMQATQPEVLYRRDVDPGALHGQHPIGLYCQIELDGQRATVSTDHLLDAPGGAKVGDAYQPELDVTGDTAGVACGDGYEVPFAGMCPVQGEGEIDGHPCYYRARGRVWSLEVYGPGGSAEKSEAIWSTGRACYVWPDAGYLRADLSVQNIEGAVAEFRAWKAANP